MTSDFDTSRKALKTKRLWDFTLAALARLFLIAGLLLSTVSVTSIWSSRSDVPTQTVLVGPDSRTPALRLGPVLAPGGPGSGGPTGAVGTVIVVHGFAGSKEFMRDIDYSLARAGFEVYGVDLPGHGRSGLPLRSDSLPAWFSELLADMRQKGLISPGRVYFVGHSLGTAVVTKGALDNPGLGVRGVVALSPIFAEITPTEPANYLALIGEGEIAGVKDTAMKALRLGTGLSDPKQETVYGDYAAGTARAAATVKGASHVSLPDAKVAIGSAVKWLRSASGEPIADLPRLERERAERSFGAIGVAMLLLGLFYYGAGALGLLGHGARRPDARALVEDARVAAGLPARPAVAAPTRAPSGVTIPAKPVTEGPLPPVVVEAKERATQLFTGTRAIPLLYALAMVVAVAVPGLAGPLSFLRQNGPDYLTVQLLVFAAVMGPLLAYTGRFIKAGRLVDLRTRLGLACSLALGAALAALVVGSVGWFVTFAWTAALPPLSRAGHLALLFAMFAPFAVIDELVRGSVHDRTGFWWGLITIAIGKTLLMLSWYLGLLFPTRPTALLLVGPILVSLLVVLDVFLSLLYNEHGSWVANAVVKAAALAWAVGSVFPYVA